MSNVIERTVEYGDTLHSIAQDYLGDVNKWEEIAILNNLDYPFIVNSEDSSSENLKKPGDKILIPILDVRDVQEIPKDMAEDLYANMFGHDLALFENTPEVNEHDSNQGELRGDTYGDVVVVRGLNNLRQAIMNRFSTPMGSLIRHPNYGSVIDGLVGTTGTYENLHKIKIEVERVIRCDSRVEGMSFKRYEMVGDAVYADVIIKAMGIEKAFIMSIAFGEGGVIEWA